MQPPENPKARRASWCCIDLLRPPCYSGATVQFRYQRIGASRRVQNVEVFYFRLPFSDGVFHGAECGAASTRPSRRTMLPTRCRDPYPRWPLQAQSYYLLVEDPFLYQFKVPCDESHQLKM